MSTKLEELLMPNILLLSIVGIWPSSSSNSNQILRYFAYFRIIVHFLSVLWLVLAIIRTIYLTWGNVAILADFGSVMFFYILMIFKLAYVIIRRCTCLQMYQEIKDLWEITDKLEERQSIEYSGKLANIITTSSLIAGISNVIIFTIPPAIKDLKYRFLADNNRTNMHRILPLDLSYGFDYQSSPTFEILFVVQLIGFLCAVSSVVGNDCTVMTATIHISGQFGYISSRLQAIATEIYHRKHVDDFAISVQIGRCIKHHQRILRAAKELNGIVGPMAFGQILSSGLVVCLTSFAVIKGNSSHEEIIKYIILLMGINLQLLVWCLPGEILIQESISIAQTTFSDLPWFMLPTNLQRDLCFFLFRTQKECKIVGFTQIMSIRKFTEVFNAAGSYMALLRSMQD